MNAIIWPMSVRLIFTLFSSPFVQAEAATLVSWLRANARGNNEDQVHGDTDTDNGDSVHQAGTQEESCLQLGRELRLAGRTLDQLSAEQAYTDCGTQTTKTHHDGGSDNYEFHVYLLE
jgi:hypothetical protein